MDYKTFLTSHTTLAALLLKAARKYFLSRKKIECDFPRRRNFSAAGEYKWEVEIFIEMHVLTPAFRFV